MDWSNEPYVRVYTRETDDDLALSWEARALWDRMMTKFDRSGFVETKRGPRGLAAITRIPLPVVERVLPELLEDGRLVAVEGGFVAPNFIAAQEATKSDRQRQKDSRDRRRAQALDVTTRDGAVTNRDETITQRDLNVTDSHSESRAVTLTSAVLPVADRSLELPTRAIDTSAYQVAKDVWTEVSAARVQIAAEFKIPNIIALPDRFGMPSEPRGCRELRDRVREEGDTAIASCKHVVANLIAQAREEKTVEWLSEKAFTAGGWQTARNWTPGQQKTRAAPRAAGAAIGAADPRKDHPISDAPRSFKDLR
jgi:hypothetical protein